MSRDSNGSLAYRYMSKSVRPKLLAGCSCFPEEAADFLGVGVIVILLVLMTEKRGWRLNPNVRKSTFK